MSSSRDEALRRGNMTRTATPPRLQRRTHLLLRGLGLLHPRAQAAALTVPALHGSGGGSQFLAGPAALASPLSSLPPTCTAPRSPLTSPKLRLPACLPGLLLRPLPACLPCGAPCPAVRQISPSVCFRCCVVAARSLLVPLVHAWAAAPPAGGVLAKCPALSSAPPAASQYRRRCRPLSPPRPRPRPRALPTSLPSSHPTSLTSPHLISPLPSSSCCPASTHPPPLPLRTPPPLCEHRRM